MLSIVHTSGPSGNRSGEGWCDTKWIVPLCIAVCLFVTPSLSWGSTVVSAWQNLSTLRAGQKIQVINKSHGKHSGAFFSFDDQSIKLHESAGHTAYREKTSLGSALQLIVFVMPWLA